MGKGNRVPLSARERHGMIALLTVGLLLIGGGFFVRSCDAIGGRAPGVVLTSDTDTIDTRALYYESEYQEYGRAGKSKSEKRKKSKRQMNDSTGYSSTRKKRKQNSAPQPVPERRHLEEDLLETR